MEAPNVLLLDEPTNDLDIETLKILEDYLDDFNGAVITVSHDRYFLDRICNKIFSYEGKGEIKKYEGNYSDYLIHKEKDKVVDKEEKTVDKNKISVNKKVEKIREKKLKFTFKEQKEFEIIDSDIEILENKIISLDEEMSKYSSDFSKLQELMKEKEEVEKNLEFKYERWEYLNDLAQKIEESKKQ